MPVDLLKNIADQVPQGRALLGMDVGKKTIGLALSDPGHCVATPLMTLRRVKFSKDVEALKEIIADYEIGGFVIGLPVNMDGSEGPNAQSVRDFALEFEKFLLRDKPHTPLYAGVSETSHEIPVQDGDCRSQVWIALWDERLSTASVNDLVDKSVSKRKTKINAKQDGLIDKLAAQIILQGALDYLDMSS